MKKTFLLILCATITLLTKAQSNEITIGKVDTIYSKILNEKREVWVHVPSHNNNENDKNHYPVLYYLDGDWHFSAMVGLVEELSYVNGNSICPEMIIVGILNKDRFKDLTPSLDKSISPTSGNNANFISFIEKELIPYIDSNYNTEPYKIFLGHSLGGLTVINALIKNDNSFNAYVAIDPSLWWDNQKYLRETKKVLQEKNFSNIKFFLAVANSLEDGIDTLSVKKDSSRNTLHMRSNLEMLDFLKINKPNGLNYNFKYYGKENHGSVPLIAAYDALHYVFDFYNLALAKKDYADTTLALPNRISNHYKMISQKMGYQVKPSENFINMLGYTSMMKKNYKQAEYYFRLNADNFPESFNVYDSYGDYFAEVGQKSKAIEMYSKALSINNNPETSTKLKKLNAN